MPEPSSEITTAVVDTKSTVLSRDRVVADAQTGVGSGGIPPKVEAGSATADESREDSGASGEPIGETPSSAVEFKQRTVDTFSEERQHCSERIQSAAGANAALEMYVRQKDQKQTSGSPFSQMSSESSAALLLRIEEINTKKDGDIDSDLLKELRHRVATDAASSALFYPELYANLSSEQLAREVSAVSSAITAGESVSGHQLRILL